MSKDNELERLVYALVSALPRCAYGGCTALWATQELRGVAWCDRHIKSSDACVLPHAEALMALVTFLNEAATVPKAPTALAPMEDAIRAECNALAELLCEKNRKYGNSALEPVRIFSKAPPDEQIRVRLDDKLSRLRSGQGDETEDVEQDLMGCLVLLRIARKKHAGSESPAQGEGEGTACRVCKGKGYRTYNSTATWRKHPSLTGNMVGAALTGDVCDVCWGSGNAQDPGWDLMRLYAAADVPLYLNEVEVHEQIRRAAELELMLASALEVPRSESHEAWRNLLSEYQDLLTHKEDHFPMAGT